MKGFALVPLRSVFPGALIPFYIVGDGVLDVPHAVKYNYKNYNPWGTLSIPTGN